VLLLAIIIEPDKNLSIRKRGVWGSAKSAEVHWIKTLMIAESPGDEMFQFYGQLSY
jgi:hypothetical protein